MIPIPLALVIVGLAMTALGLWLNRRVTASLDDYRPESDHESGREAADRTSGLALMHSWSLVILGVGAIAIAAYLHYWVGI